VGFAIYDLKGKTEESEGMKVDSKFFVMIKRILQDVGSFMAHTTDKKFKRIIINY